MDNSGGLSGQVKQALMYCAPGQTNHMANTQTLQTAEACYVIQETVRKKSKSAGKPSWILWTGADLLISLLQYEYALTDDHC